MRIHHVVASVLPQYGGPSYSVPALCSALAKAGHEVTLHLYEPTGSVSSDGYAIRAYHRFSFLENLGLSRDMAAGLNAAARDGDIMHVHGQWRLCNVWPSWAVRGTTCQLVTSPRGMLDGWAMAQSELKKKIMWTACQRAAVQASGIIHATALAEAEAVWRLGIRAPAAIIPNGVAIPPDDQVARFSSSPRTLLFLGRIHPKKGIDRLISAWATIQQEFPDWQMQVVGPDNSGYLPILQAQVDECKAQRVSFAGPAFGDAKRRLFENAQLFALPTHSENFGISVAEALAFGVPAIVSHGAPWSGLDSNQCGRWTGNAPHVLANSLRELMALSPAELRAMGQRGRAWMISDYSWQECTRMMTETYRWLREGGPPCSWILRAPP